MISGKKFDKKYFSSGSYNNYEKILTQWVKPEAKRIYQILKDKPSAKILDIGCGFGNLLAELQDKYHFLVTGIEYSPYAIQRAQSSVKSKIKKGNILRSPFKKNNFDLVVCFDVVPHLTLEETKRAVKNLVSVSRNYIFFSSIYRHSIYASQKLNPDPLRLTTLSTKNYINLFSKNGARLIRKFYGENGGDILVFKKILK